MIYLNSNHYISENDMSITTINKATLEETKAFMQNVVNKNPNEEEFHQAVHEVAESVIPFILENPEYKK